MISRKFIFAAVVSVVLFTGNIVFADSNDLLRMDVKKASSEDTIDVIFYTTGAPTNTVVTRKSGNSYVVLMPNVSGNQSVVPSLGGVRDLISDVNVKAIDDGIGGYTKVTFNTTKPVKIQTYTKKTAPLTKAQQDYKNLIVQNSKFDPDKKMEHFKQTSSEKPINKTVADVIKSAKTTITPVKQASETKEQPSKTAQNKTTTQNTTKIAVKPIDIHVPTIKREQVNTQKSTAITPKTENIKTENNTVPAAQTTSTAEVKPAFDLVNPPAESKSVQKTEKKQQTKKVKTKTIRKDLPIIPLAGALSVIGIFLLVTFMNIISRAVKNNAKLKEYLENYNSEPANTNGINYSNILEKDNLNWQEKYKLYSEAKQNEGTNETNSSYITDMAGTKGVIIPDDMKTRVAQMEHALSQTSPDVPPSSKVSKTVSKNLSGLNLKTFSKNINLKKTNRNTIPQEEYNSVTEPLKEGKFVNLDNSELTMSQRNIGGHGFSISDLLRTGRRYLSKKQNTEELSEQQEQYLISSLEEYLNIIDSEENKQEKNITEEITNLIPKRSRADMMLSTNPMSKQKSPFKKTGSESSDFGGITVSSKYDIDTDKSIFMIESDGISALIGKIGENITVLKKFDKIVRKPLQVRLDYGSVYIVKVGDFKCLVDVAEEKMGTLLEI